MFLLEPERTPYDLSWRMFGIDVRVHPMFWLMAALLGWPALEDGPAFLLMWIVCVFVSILVHELGHVFAGRTFGADGQIVLYSFGGLAIGSSQLPERWQRNIVYFAGPLAGFILFLAVLTGVLLALPGDLRPIDMPLPLAWMGSVRRSMRDAGWSNLAMSAVMDLFWINLFWGLLNLLPIWPLDGGRISRETCEWLSRRQGTRAAMLISGLLAGILAVNSIMAYFRQPLLPAFVPVGGLYTALFFGMLSYSSFQLMQAESQRQRWIDDARAPWERSDDEDDRR